LVSASWTIRNTAVSSSETRRHVGLLLEGLGLPFQGGTQPKVVEQPRAQLQGEMAHTFEQVLGHLERLLEFRAGGCLARGFELEPQAGQQLSDLIVQFLGERPSFVLLDPQQLGRERLETGRVFLGASFRFPADGHFMLEVFRACGDLRGQ
jgi:hypothetical protein